MALLAVVGIGSVLYVFGQVELEAVELDEVALTSFICTAEVQSECGPENSAALFSGSDEDRELITFADLPQNLIDAVIATEDAAFFEHQGVDPRGIARAAYQSVRNREGVQQGGSTITQQYVKLQFKDDDKSLARKAREVVRAVKLEQELTDECARRVDLGFRTPTECAKQEILTRYLNLAPFGRGTSGVQAASRSYFGKDVSDLTVEESAFLAGLLRAPYAAEPEEDAEEASRRRTSSLQRMLEAGLLSPAEAQAANLAPWNLRPRVSREGLGEVRGADFGSEYFIEEVRKQLFELFPNGEVYTGGLRVYTTLDQGLQRAAYESAHTPKAGEDLTTRELPELGPLFLDPNNPADPAAALVSIDSQGRVVAMLGGTNFAENEFNLATSSGGVGRQPGSTFKTFGLALAIEQGLSARSLYPAPPGDLEIEGPCNNSEGEPWTVKGGSSAQNRYRDLLDGLRWSANIVYAQLVVDVGPGQLRDLTHRMGVTSDLGEKRADGTVFTPCSIILGSEEAPVIDIAAAYSVFEHDGVRLDPILIDRVENADGEVICWQPVNVICGDGPDREGTRVLAPETVGQINYALSQVVNGGTGKRARFAEDWQILGKTGTSTKHVDGWFAGFTCGLTTVVWIGHDGDEQIKMIDFRKPLAEGETEKPRNEEGEIIDDGGWPNISGGNFPSMLWADYMRKATAGQPPCTGLRIQEEFPGSRLNQNLSVTTLPPCGVQLDEFGYPVGRTPENFVFLTTTTTPPIQPGQPGQPNPNPVQNGACTPLNQWIAAAFPGSPIPVPPPPNPDPNGPTTVPGDSTTVPGQPTTQPIQPQPTQPQPTQPQPTQTRPTQPSSSQPPTTAPIQPPSSEAASPDNQGNGSP